MIKRFGASERARDAAAAAVSAHITIGVRKRTFVFCVHKRCQSRKARQKVAPPNRRLQSCNRPPIVDLRACERLRAPAS